MESPPLRLLVSLGMLALCYWVTVGPKGWASVGDASALEDVDSLLASSRDQFAAGNYHEALGSTEAVVARYPTQHVSLERQTLTTA